MDGTPKLMLTGIRSTQKLVGFRATGRNAYSECENDNCGEGYGDCADCGDDCQTDCNCDCDGDDCG